VSRTVTSQGRCLTVAGLAVILGLTGAATSGASVPALTRKASNSSTVAAASFTPVIYTPPSTVDRTPTGSAPTGSYALTTAPRSGTVTSAATASQVSPNAAPVGTSAGAAGLGILGAVGLEKFPLESALSAQVNVGNGNLIISGQDLSINGPGLSVNLTRFYNGLSSGSGAFGAGWTMSTGRDVGLSVSGSSVTFTGPSGFQVVYAANGSGGYTMPANINADLVRNADGTYRLTYRGSGEVLSFSSGGFLTRDADRNGNALALSYNTDNTLASVTDTAGRVTTLQYTGPGGGNGRVTGYTDPAGRQWRYGYDGYGDLTTTQDFEGHTTQYGYDSGNRLTQVVTAQNHIMNIGYDTSYRVVSVTRFVGSTSGPSAVTGFAYGSGSTVETNPDGKTYTYALDSAQRPVSVTDPLGHQRSQTFTANGDVSSAADAMGTGSTPGNTSTYRFDSANNPTAATSPTGAGNTAQYSGSSSCASTDTTHPYLAKCSADAQGNTTQAWYDTAGNATMVADTAGGTTTGPKSTASYQGDPKTGGGIVGCGGRPGQVCTSTTPNGGVTSYGYDSNGELTSVTPPSPLGAETLGYDSLSRLTSVTDGKGQQSTYSYNAEDLATYTTWAGGDSVQKQYDNDGNVTQQNDNRNGGNGYTYDGLGRQTQFGETGTTTASSVTYDPAGNVVTATDGTGTVSYTYDAANELTSLVEPGTGSCPAGAYGSAGCTYFTYDANGHVLQTTYPGYTVQTATYDHSGRATHVKATYGSTTLSDLSYSYTAATAGPTGSTDREITQTRTDALGVGGPAGSTTTYGYDDQQRLTGAAEKTSTGATNASWSYGYDTDGNRTTASTLLAGTTTNTNYGYNAADELATINGSTAGLSYDANGNETANPGTPALTVPSRVDTLNSRDQVTTITTGGSTSTPFTYTGAGNAERTSVGSPSGSGLSTTNTLLGLGSQTAASSPTTAFTRTPGGALVSLRTGGTSYYYLTDDLGSVVALVSTTGAKTATYAYDPFGNLRLTMGPTAAVNPIRFTGGYQDPTGLYHFGARYYDPALGRFTQPDPSQQEANNYAYAGSCPSDATDPNGLFGFHPFALAKCSANIAELAFDVGPVFRAFTHVKEEVGGLRALFRLLKVARSGRAVVSDAADQVYELFDQLTGVGDLLKNCIQAFA